MPYVHVTIAHGRSSAEKRALMSAVADAVTSTISAPPETVHVWIAETELADMSIAGEPLDERRARLAGTP